MPTRLNPHAQIKWIFFQFEGGSSSTVVNSTRWATGKYISYVIETSAGYPELKDDQRFYLSRCWEADALIRFNDWLVKQELASKTRYALYKTVRRVMDLAYGIRVIDAMVYHAPMFKGVSETNQLAAYLPEEQEVLNSAIARWIGLAERIVCGYAPMGNGVPYRGAGSHVRGKGKKNAVSEIESIACIDENANAIGGNTVDSIKTSGIITISGKEFDCSVDGRNFRSIKELARAYNVTENNVRSRLLRGLTVRQSVELDTYEPKRNSRSEIVVEGIKYPSINEAIRVYDADLHSVKYRLSSGYTVEQAFGLAPRFVKQSDERALLWSFENEYDCNPASMARAFIDHKLHFVCTADRMRQLFTRWGVWANIDDRLVMPLAVEFAMLTGLNVEAIKDLDIDCFQEEHGLTGKPVIHYRKKRSASYRRSAQKELHLPLLEVHDMHLEESRIEKIRRLHTLILAVTKQIRVSADESIAKRLFLFEDVERSIIEKRVVVVAIDPKRKAGKWYRKFTRDENLTAILGNGFSFNMARCRPTLVTNMVLDGADMLKVQAVLGHGSIETTASYLDERQLQPKFNKTVSEALHSIAGRSAEIYNEPVIESCSIKGPKPRKDEFSETLSGCGCSNPYNPSDDVREITFYKTGSVCKFWNMCFFCDRAVITEDSLPKLIVYQNRLIAALKVDSPSIRSRKELYSDVIKMIESIVNTEQIFPKSVTDNARIIAGGLDDILVDQLVYQGL